MCACACAGGVQCAGGPCGQDGHEGGTCQLDLRVNRQEFEQAAELHGERAAGDRVLVVGTTRAEVEIASAHTCMQHACSRLQQGCLRRVFAAGSAGANRHS